MKSETAWQAGRLGSARGPSRLLFGRMYEDSEIEQVAFKGKGRVFCIASAGTTALRMADEHEVVACDINPTQLAYVQRRAHGGPEETGDVERAMNVARAFMPLVGWRTKVVRAFLALSEIDEQLAFWKKHLNTRRFRTGFDTLMSPAILRAMYASQFLRLLPPKFGAVLRKRMERGFARHQNASNPYARALLLGETSEDRRRAANIKFVLADAACWLESCPPGFFDGFALSNILDGAETSYRSRLSRAVRRAATNDAIVVLRSFAEPPLGFSGNHAARDRSMLWGVVDVCNASTFAANFSKVFSTPTREARDKGVNHKMIEPS